MSRAVALIDMDCFYVQVEQRDNAAFWGKPCAVLQGSGLLIAVSYEARDLGVTRGHRVKEARMICPEIHLFNVPEPRGKADLTKYRNAGAEVITVLSHFERCLVERASIDEAYVDMTQEVNARLVAMETCSITADQLPNTFVVGWEVEDDGKTGINPASIETWLRTMDESDRRLAVAAIVTEEMRAAILRDCGFHCSAGIAHNKLLAKLVCSRHKPSKQTVLPLAAVNTLFMTTPVQKIRLLGGKLGCEVTQQLGVEFVAELCQFSEKQLQLEFGEKQGSWLYQVCRGVDNEPVRPRRLAKSIGCGKNFPGIEQLDTEEKVHHWLRMMSLELEERLIRDKHENKRQARLLTVHVRTEGKSHSIDASRSCPILRYEADKICSDSLLLLRKFQQPRDSLCSHHTWTPAILNLSMSASKFDDLQSNSSSIKQFVFKTQSSPMCGGSSASMVRSSDPICGSCVSIPGSSDLMRRSSASVVRSSDPMHGSSIPIPGSSVSKSGSPGSVVRSSDPMHGSSTSLSGSSDTMHVSADPTHESSDIVSGSLSSMPGSSAQKIGSSSEDNNISFFMAAYTLKTCQPADRCPLYSCVQTLPDTHRHTDPEDVMSSCHSSTVSHLQLHHNDGCHLGHHCNDHCSGQCNTANETDSSSLGQTQSLTGICEDKPAENCEYECGDMLRTDKDVTDANDIIREDQETDTVIGRSELESAAACAAASENGTVESRCISDTSTDMTQCHKCGVTIDVWKILEHSDFHLAVELQEQETVTSNSKRKSTDSGSQTKKRRNSVRNATTLHRFFEAS